MRKVPRIPIWVVLTSLIFLGVLIFSLSYVLTNPHDDTNNNTSTTTYIKIKTALDLTFSYGASLVKEQNSQAKLLSNGNSFQSIEAVVTTNTTLRGVSQDINGTLQVLFDNNIKKQINLTSPTDSSLEAIGTIVVTSAEIEGWDASQNTTHTIVFRVPEDTIKIHNSTSGDDKNITLRSSESTLKIQVSPQPKTPNYTISQSGSDYITMNSIGQTIYIGPSASQAIQIAFDSVNPGQTILIKSAIYNITDTLTLTEDNVTLAGENSTILQASGNLGRIFLFTGASTKHASGLTMSNLVFDCNLTASGLRIKWCDRVTLNGVEIENVRKVKFSNGLEIVGTSGSVISGVTITNCYIHNIYGSGINLAYASDCKVNSNTFVDCAQYYPSGGAVHADDGCQRITVQNNDISGRSDNDGIYVGTERSFASGCVITGNTISLRLYGTGGGPSLAGSGIKVYTLKSEVAGNTINWNDAPYVYGIENWGKSNNIHDNVISNAHVGIGDFTDYYRIGNNTISNNVVSSTDYGMVFYQQGSIVAKNFLKGTQYDGIDVNGADTEIDYNNLTNCGQDSNYYGIRLESGANNCNLYNNSITSNTSSLGIGDFARGTTYNKP